RDVRVLDEALSDDRALPDDDVHDPLGDPRFESKLADPKRRQRRQLGRLEDDRVPTGECRPELPARDVGGEVPGDDEPDHTEWLAERRRDTPSHGNRLAAVLVDGAGVEVEDLRDHPDLAAGAGDRLADVLGLDTSKVLGVLLDERREAT